MNPPLFSFEGRMGRKTFFIRSIVLGIISLIIIFPVQVYYFNQLRDLSYFAANYDDIRYVQTESFIVTGIISVVLSLFNLPNAVRRLHDIDKSGWWILIAFVPLIGGIWLLVYFFIRGTIGDNNYGADPKANSGSSFGGKGGISQSKGRSVHW